MIYSSRSFPGTTSIRKDKIQGATRLDAGITENRSFP